MENPDPRNAVSSFVKAHKRMIRLVQVAPFAYLLLLALYLFTESIMPDWMLRVADNALNVPMLGVVGLLGAGHILKLCTWFKTACLLPMAAKVESIIDSFVLTLTQCEITMFNVILGALFVTYLCLSYKHFFAR